MHFVAHAKQQLPLQLIRADRIQLVLQADLHAMDVDDRMKRIAPFWKGLLQSERVEVMTLSVKDVKAQAKIVAKKDAEKGDGMVFCEITCVTFA